MSNRRDVFSAHLDFETLLAHADSDDKSLRWAAAIELGEHATKPSVIALWAMRNDNDDNVRAAAQLALGRMDRALLESALNSEEARAVSAAQESHIPVELDDSGFEEFVSWKVRPLEVPSAENEWAVAAAINDIVSTEGPMTGLRLLKLYGQAAFPNAPKKVSKYRIKGALLSLFSRRILGRCDTAGPDEIDHWIVYRLGEPEVRIRNKGNRTYAEIPINEVRELIQEKMGYSSNQSADRKFKVLMEAYAIPQRDLHLLGALFEKEWASLL
jgi:hypothetical protein